MAASDSTFPAKFRAVYEPGNAFAAFKADARKEIGEVTRIGRQSAEELKRVMADALTRPANAAGGLDLGVPKMREAVAVSEQRAAALREVISAAERLPVREGAMTTALQAKIAATRVELAAEEESAQVKREQVVIYEALQREILDTAIAQGRLTAAGAAAITAGSRAAVSIGQQRAGYQQLGFQVSDVAQQLSLGINPMVVFAQQGGQVVQALQLMYGSGNRFLAFLAGPWGAALMGAATVVGFATAKLFEHADATTNAISATEGLSQAQSALSGLFDLATGKILDQTGVLSANTQAQLLNAQATAIRLRTEAARQTSSAREVFSRSGEGSWLGYLQAAGSRAGRGSQFGVIGREADEQRRLLAAIRNAPNEEARQAARLAAQRAASRPNFGQGTRVSGDEFMQAIADELNAAANNASADATDEAIRRFQNGGSLPELLRRRNNGGGRSRSGGGNAAAQLAEFGEDAGRRIGNVIARFQEAPPVIEAARRAMGELNDVASDLERRKPPKYQSMLEQIDRARDVITETLDGPYRDWTEEQDRQAEIQRLINSGRTEEAEIVQTTYRLQQQQGKLSEEAIADIRERIEARAAESRLAEEERRRQQAYLQSIDQIRSSLESTIANLGTRGLRGIGDVASTLFGQFRQLSAANIVERLFGGTFRELEGYVSGRGRVIESNQQMAGAADEVTSSLEGLKDAIEGATDALAGGVGTGGSKSIDGAVKGMADSLKQAVDDVGEEIVVTGQRRKGAAPALADLSPRDFSIRAITGLLGPLGLDERLTRRISAGVADAMQGAFVGQSAASILLGGRGSSTGAALGGILGQEAGKALGRTIGKEAGGLLGTLGSAAGPIGSIVGGIAGSLLGGLLTSTPRASSTIGAGANGELAITGTAGTSSLRGRSIEAADSVVANVSRIAELFGASVDASRGSVSIGMRKDTYRVDPTGQGRTKLSKGAVEYQDAESAVRAAVLDLIRDGVITGLRAGTQRLLQAAKDLDSGVQKALDFEQVFKDLKAKLDPVGAAIDGVNLKFDRLRKIFAEAGASASDLADLEKLYGLERADAIKQASEAMTSSLRGLIDDLTVNNDARSLRERLSLARAAYDPLAARVAAGDTTVDYAEFSDAARTVEQLARQIYGSGQDYFATADSILALAQTALDHQNSIIAAATGSDGSTTGPDSHDTNVPVVSAVDRLGDRLVTELAARLDVANDNQATMVRLLANLELSGNAGRANKLYGF